MQWRVVAGLLAIVLATIWTADSRDDRITATDDRPVLIASLPCQSQQTTSSGFVVDDELVVTVAHAIFESRDFAVRDAGGKWYNAYVQSMDVDRDLAIVRVPGLGASAMASAPATENGAVQMLEGAASGTVSGRVARSVSIRIAVVGDPDTVKARRGYELALDISPGDSGAAVVDEQDRLVAIAFARSTRRQGMSWATALSEIEIALQGDTVPDWDCGPARVTKLVLTPPALERLEG